ncbi:MAG: hypothetical protein M3527_01745 [Actinomycetota bacterium]|nr:hypothetical protein [Acidimicrobiia bacterium]MDQ3293165.1 hypothetical protein [Actinomycetota bacterium]
MRVLGTGEVAFDLPAIDKAELARPVDWYPWFAAFERWKLAFLYQARRADGSEPTYNSLAAST